MPDSASPSAVAIWPELKVRVVGKAVVNFFCGSSTSASMVSRRG